MAVSYVGINVFLCRCTVDVLVELYTFLHSQWSVCGTKLYEAFRKHKLIHFTGKLYGISEVVWMGDPMILRTIPILGMNFLVYCFSSKLIKISFGNYFNKSHLRSKLEVKTLIPIS